MVLTSVSLGMVAVASVAVVGVTYYSSKSGTNLASRTISDRNIAKTSNTPSHVTSSNMGVAVLGALAGLGSASNLLGKKKSLEELLEELERLLKSKGLGKVGGGAQSTLRKANLPKAIATLRGIYMTATLASSNKSKGKAKSNQGTTTGGSSGASNGQPPKKPKGSSKKLRKNLKKAGEKEPNYPNHAHHIVAGGSENKFAKEARVVLAKFNIGIDDAVNGVFLPSVKGVSKATYHRGMHTDAYFKKVNWLLDKAKSKEKAIRALNKIAKKLLEGTF